MPATSATRLVPPHLAHALTLPAKRHAHSVEGHLAEGAHSGGLACRAVASQSVSTSHEPKYVTLLDAGNAELCCESMCQAMVACDKLPNHHSLACAHR